MLRCGRIIGKCGEYFNCRFCIDSPSFHAAEEKELLDCIGIMKQVPGMGETVTYGQVGQ
jgi:hypothetical protein